MPRDVSSIANVTGIMLVGATALLVATFASGAGMPMPSPRAWALLFALALGGGLLAYFLWNAGVAAIGPGAAAPFINLVPVASMLISTGLGAPPTHAQLFGGAIVIAAVSLSTRASAQAETPLAKITPR